MVSLGCVSGKVSQGKAAAWSASSNSQLMQGTCLLLNLFNKGWVIYRDDKTTQG